jgi:rhamnogalacturonan endolyase
MLLQAAWAQPYTGERLDRGLAGIPTAQGFYLSWRMLPADPAQMAFDVYRSTDGGQAVKLNDGPVIRTSDFLDTGADLARDNRWSLRSGGRELASWHRPAGQDAIPYLRIPLDPPGQRTTFGTDETYRLDANDASVGDLDGDGQYEIILKWEPSNRKLPPNRGYAGNTLIDAYKLDGTRLWRIDLGHNIRSGPPTTQFLVFDFDGDGCAELCCKTADGTVDGTGRPIGDPTLDNRVADEADPAFGKVHYGLEYVTVFDGRTGRALATEEYIPTRYPMDSWGGWGGNGGTDNLGERSDRFSAGVGCFDGKTPSPFFVRGWYGRTVVAAWTFTEGRLKPLWTFDSSERRWAGYSGMGNHSVTVGDFDGDGFDEVCVGSMIVDHDGAPVPGADIGRGVAADIDPRFPGAECWGSGSRGLRSCATGEVLTDSVPSSTNFIIFWDADPYSELLDRTTISKWNWETGRSEVLLAAQGVVACNGSKATPCVSADLLGDWREEVVWATPDNSELRIYLTDIPAENRMPTLMSDRMYRLAIAWQNVAYNQPPHPSFDMAERFEQIRQNTEKTAR